MGQGSLFLRTRLSHGKTERRWVATVRMPNGSRPSSACPHDHGPRDKRPCPEAEAKLAELQAIRELRLPLDVRTLTVGRYLERWSIGLTDEMAPSTIRQHREIIANWLVPNFPMLLKDLRPSDVDAYLARKHRSPHTLRNHRATLRRALSDAVRDGYIERNPVSLSRAPKSPVKDRRYLTAAEAKRLIETTRDMQLWPLWTLLVSTGLRLSEALGLAWSDIRDGQLNVRRQVVRVNGAWEPVALKTDRSRRTIPMNPRAIEAIEGQKERRRKWLEDKPEPVDGLVFTTSTGAPIHGTNVLPPFRRALARAGLPRVTLHTLRHSYAAIALGAGVELIVVSRTLGHSSIRITADIYAEVVPELFEDAAEKMARALA